MGTRFVEVPAAAIREKLVAAGFCLIPAASGEEIYERKHDRDPKYSVKVYSSISRGAEGVRECGTDAIRVVAILTTPRKVYPIYKSMRVYRTGSIEAVLERMIERARGAYAACNVHLANRGVIQRAAKTAFARS